jgi:hypothetical protein
MFSSRLPWDAPENRLSHLLRELRTEGAPVLDLTESNPTSVGLFSDGADGAAGQDLLRALADPRALRYQPTPRGLPAARAAVAGYYARRGIPVDPDHLVLCASTSEAYAWIFQLLCDAGDEVLFPQPSYPLFSHLAGLCLVRLVPYPLFYEGHWRIDLHALETAISPRTRAVLLVSPNNPTGSILRRADLDALESLCQGRDLCLIADEVFGDYVFSRAARGGQGADEADHVPSLINAAPRVPTFTLSGLSKVLGLPQLKLGWIHVSGPARDLVQDRLELIADTFLSVGAPVQWAAETLLGQQPRVAGAIRRRVEEGFALLRARCQGSACQLLHAEGGWYGVLRVPRVMSEEEWVLTLLEQDRVLCHPGYFFDFPEEAYLIISLLPPPQVLDEGIGRILQRVARACAP